MKKILAIALCLMMVLACVACGAAEKEYKLGMGVVVSMDSSATGNAQVDATVAAVVTDADGKIVSARIDVAQNKMAVAEGAVDTAKVFETKKELGDRYGMAGKIDNNDDGVMKEWFEQVEALETYLVGKTLADVEAMTTTEAKGHQITTDADLLAAGCSMDIVAFREAVIKALKDEQGMSFKTAGTIALGVAANSTAAESKAATADAEGTVAMYSDFAASVVVDGKIVATLNDAIQPKISINAAGEITAKTYTDTKRCLKEGYHMAEFGATQDNNGDGKVLEWYLQSEAFSKHIVGKTADEVAAMTTAAATQGAVGYEISTDADLLAAGCTIQIAGIRDVVVKSAKNAK